MAFFYSFTDSLKQKWLQFFQNNRDWIKLHMQVESVYTPDGGKRPPSYLILGVANALEPKLAQLMLPFSKLNPDADTLVEVLDLNFDPDIALGNHIPKTEGSQQDNESAAVMEEKSHDETLTTSETDGFGNDAIAHDLEVTYNHEETLMVPDTMLRDELRAMATETLSSMEDDNSSPQDPYSKNEFQQMHETDAADEFGDISFDGIKEVDNTISAVPNENGFADVLSDVWGNETASFKGEANTDIFLGEELSTNGLDDSEIASLFPNT
ncbi:DUF5331 domain-containing protein [Fischerella sp. PCC 9605]|uniref:DUF5331 domain-containing protein n=1 Tax=Fischerella sp. PCC 9605 TaxID=1173024 RepID=UPI00047DB791|nr:DUF5331 domain-containing protein [Fischerella sp. PCC 9605]